MITAEAPAYSSLEVNFATEFCTKAEAARSNRASKAAAARNASGRRRSVDPATCERDYSAAEWEFMQAMQEYKLRSGRMFPTWSEALEVLRGLGYHKVGV